MNVRVEIIARDNESIYGTVDDDLKKVDWEKEIEE